MAKALKAMWQLFTGLLFYPIMIGIFLWVYAADKHWILGVLVIAAILILDPIWRIIGRQALDMLTARK